MQELDTACQCDLFAFWIQSTVLRSLCLQECQ